MHVSQSFRAGVAALSFAVVALGGNVAAADAATFSVVHAFTGTDGLLPQGHLFYDYLAKMPVLVGATEAGGSNANSAGTVYSYNLKTGAFADMYSFMGPPDGQTPLGGISVDLNKNGPIGQIVGSAANGGTSGDGTLYKIATNGAYTSVYSFGSIANPNDVFSPLDGMQPSGTVSEATDGNFYGTTSAGGAGASGTIFRYSPSTGAVTTIYTFNNNPAVIDGENPAEGLSLGFNGVLYGTTPQGGTFGEGTIFSITTSGTYTTLYSFTGGSDGANPQSLISVDKNNNLYGTAPSGGGSKNAGTVWEFSGKALSVLYTFKGGKDGSTPTTGVSFGAKSVLYGTTSAGGTNDIGTIFSIDPSTKAYKKLHSFTAATDGSDPESTLLIGPDGSFFGTAIRDGANGFGTLFNIKV